LKTRVANDDFVVISEKAVSTAMGNILDEAAVTPTRNARFLAQVWMRWVWGYFLGVICRFGPRLIRRLRTYPVETGSRHKQVALERAGFSEALMFGSEGGIDGSNLAYSYVSLPLGNAEALAEEIRLQVKTRLNKNITVLIADTDKTYSFRNFHFTPRPTPMQGIQSHGGILAYTAGRILNLKKRPTPLAVSGAPLNAEEALKLANIADRARGPGSGATVWDMAARFKVSTTEVTWEMLEQLKHKPIVIVRKARNRKLQQTKMIGRINT
jgi:F420-0:gamma-glutamyl ligase-like protein